MDLRPGYKQTEIGVLPRDWEVCGLLDAVKIASGQVDPKLPPFNQMILVAPDHIEGRTGRLIATRTAQEVNAISGKYQFSPGDIVYSKIRPYLQKAILADFEGLCSADMYPLRPKPGVSGRYVLDVILAHRFTQYAISVSLRSGMPKINRVELADFKIALPPPAEQEAIARILSDLDAQLLALERLISKKRDLRTGVRQRLLTGATRLKGFTEEWINLRVRDCVRTFFCGPSPTCEERNIQGEQEWGVLKTTAITWEYGWDWTKHKVLPVAHWGKSSIEITSGDVIVTKAGPRSRVGVSVSVGFVPPRLVASGKMIALRPDSAMALGPMLASAIASKETQVFLDQRTTGMAESQVNFENDALLDAPIVLPKMEEQCAIVEVLSDIDSEISSLEARLEKAKALKHSMLQAFLTGCVRPPAQVEALDALEVAHA